MARQFSPQKLADLMAAEKKPLTPGRLATRIRDLNPSLHRCQKHHVQAWLEDTVPNANYLAALASALGVTMEALYEESGNGIDDMLAVWAKREGVIQPRG